MGEPASAHSMPQVHLYVKRHQALWCRVAATESNGTRSQQQKQYNEPTAVGLQGVGRGRGETLITLVWLCHARGQHD